MIQTFIPVVTNHRLLVGVIGLGSVQTFFGNETTILVAGKSVPLALHRSDTQEYVYTVVTAAPSSVPQTGDLPNYFPISELLVRPPTHWTMLPGSIPSGVVLDHGFLSAFFTSGGRPPQNVLPRVSASASFSHSQDGMLLTVVDTSTVIDPQEWSWDFGDLTTVVSDRFPSDHEYSDTGTYTVTLTVTDSSQNDYVVQHTVVVPSSPNVSVLSMKIWNLSASIANAPSCSTFDLPFTVGSDLFHSTANVLSLVISGIPPLSLLELKPFLITDSGMPTFPSSKGNKLRFVKMVTAPIFAQTYQYTLSAELSDGSTEVVLLNLTLDNLP